jgi:hypothetical protein
MPCQVDITEGEIANHFEKLLCKACKYLSAEQIDSLRNPGSGPMDGLYWYTTHLMCDYISKDNQPEKYLTLSELHRLGYDVIDSNGYSALIKLF